MKLRVGPRMRQVVDGCPWSSMLAAARAIAPHGTGIRFGYASVHRAIRHGLVTLDPTHPIASRYGQGAVVRR